MKISKIVLFEDDCKHHFYPLSLLRPVCDLTVGIFSVYERVSLLYPEAEISILCRPELEDMVKESGRRIFTDQDFMSADEYVFINSRVWFAQRHRFEFDTCCVENDELVYLHVSQGRCSDWRKIDFLDGEFLEKTRTLGLTKKDVEHTLFRYLWQMVDYCGEAIKSDVDLLPDTMQVVPAGATFHVAGDYPVIVASTAVIDRGAYIDTTSGPVVLMEQSRVRPLSLVEGPVYVGPASLVDGAKIRGNVSLGSVCKVGGEIETSVIMSYTNKHHDGFLGHAYVGEWVNIGALATNSDLRNDYGEISVSMEGRIVKTGSIKVGSIIGDHSKIGIGTMINTGTVIGICANVYSQGELVRKEVPCFVMGGKRPYREYRLNRFLDSAVTVMERRNIKMSDALRKRLLRVFAESSELRARFAGRNVE